MSGGVNYFVSVEVSRRALGRRAVISVFVCLWRRITSFARMRRTRQPSNSPPWANSRRLVPPPPSSKTQFWPAVPRSTPTRTGDGGIGGGVGLGLALRAIWSVHSRQSNFLSTPSENWLGQNRVIFNGRHPKNEGRFRLSRCRYRWWNANLNLRTKDAIGHKPSSQKYHHIERDQHRCTG